MKLFLEFSVVDQVLKQNIYRCSERVFQLETHDHLRRPTEFPGGFFEPLLQSPRIPLKGGSLGNKVTLVVSRKNSFSEGILEMNEQRSWRCSTVRTEQPNCLSQVVSDLDV